MAPASKRAGAERDVETLPYRPGVGLVVLNRRGDVFAGQRIDNPDAAWQMPQGGIDRGEAPLEAAYRELAEETGIAEDRVALLAESAAWRNYDLPEDLVPRIWGGKFRGQTQLWFAFRFLGEDREIDIETHHPEFREWDWIAPDRLISLIVPFKRDMYREIFDEFRGLFGPG